MEYIYIYIERERLYVCDIYIYMWNIYIYMDYIYGIYIYIYIDYIYMEYIYIYIYLCAEHCRRPLPICTGHVCVVAGGKSDSPLFRVKFLARSAFIFLL